MPTKTKKDDTGTVLIRVQLAGAKKNRINTFPIEGSKVSKVAATIAKMLGKPTVTEDKNSGKFVIRYKV